MGIERDSFVGNPHRQDYIDEDEDLEILSGDDIDFNPLGLLPGDPDFLLDETYDIIADDDEDYEPDDYEDFLSDSDYEYGDDDASESGLEQVFFSDSDQDMPIVVLSPTVHDDGHNKSTPATTTTTADRSGDNKLNGDIKTNDTGGIDANQATDT